MITIKYVFTIVLTLSVMAISCTRNELKQNIYVVQDMQKSVGEFSLPGKPEITYIPLEFNREYPISSVAKIITTRNDIFVLGYDYLLQYNREGKFIKCIGSQGKGPGEYIDLLDASISESSGRIFIVDGMGLKVIAYDLATGKYINQHPYEPFWWKCEAVQNSLLVNPMNTPKSFTFKPQQKFMQLSFGLDTLAKSKNALLYDILDGLVAIPDVKVFQSYDDEVIFRQPLNDTVFTFSFENQKLSMRYYFDFGNATFPIELLGSSERYEKEAVNYGFLKDVTETGEYIFAEIDFKGKTERYIIHKSTGKVYRADRGIGFDGQGIRFWPKWSCCGKDNIISCLTADYLLENKQQISDNRLKNIVSGINEESNPVVMLVKF